MTNEPDQTCRIKALADDTSINKKSQKKEEPTDLSELLHQTHEEILRLLPSQNAFQHTLTCEGGERKNISFIITSQIDINKLYYGGISSFFYVIRWGISIILAKKKKKTKRRS